MLLAPYIQTFTDKKNLAWKNNRPEFMPANQKIAMDPKTLRMQSQWTPGAAPTPLLAPVTKSQQIKPTPELSRNGRPPFLS